MFGISSSIQASGTNMQICFYLKIIWSQLTHVQVNWSKKTKRFTCKNIGPECARNSCMCDEQLAYALSQVVMKIFMHQIGCLIMKVNFS